MPSSSLVDREDVRNLVGSVIDAFLERTREQSIDELGEETAELFDAMERLLRGGKRLRAAFAYWSWRAHGGEPGTQPHEAIVGVGAALELFQAAALFHDDLMDNSDTRRGNPTAHVHFARLHRTHGWPGDDSQFGLSAAVLLGDLSLAASEHVFSEAVSALPRDASASTRAIFDAMRTEVTLGQYLDVLSQVRPWHDDAERAEREARTVIRAKSARYSVEHPISLGAALAGASSEHLAACRGFGLPLGEAFQLRDDILGVFGDPEETGKPAGDDLREGKRTVLLARAIGGASPAEAELLREKVGSPHLTDDDVDQIRDIIMRSGALAAIETLVTDLTEEAFERLDRADLTDDGREMLRELGLAAVSRAS